MSGYKWLIIGFAILLFLAGAFITPVFPDAELAGIMLLFIGLGVA